MTTTTTSHDPLRLAHPMSPRGSARQRLDPAPAHPPALVAELGDTEGGEDALYLAWQVCQWAALPDGPEGAADRAALQTVLARTLAAVAQGSSRLPVDVATQALLARVPGVVGAPGARTPFVLAGAYLYPQRLLGSEEALVAGLAGRAGRPGPFDPAAIDRVLAAVAAQGTPRPSDEQTAAVRAALSARFTVVTGGPGTGKTTIVLTLVRALLGLGIPPAAVALAAPTGKAANRLELAVRAGLAPAPGASASAEAEAAVPGPAPAVAPAQTLHRLLGYAPRAGAFLHGADHRLPHQVVIVDEGSMVDLFLMERLVRALPDDALLILLGDADQLPSVEAGAVFRDLAPQAVRLTRSFRMDPARGEGRRILEVARAVQAGDPDRLATLIDDRPDAAALTFAGVERLPPTARAALLERWYSDRIAAPRAPGPGPATGLDLGALAARLYPLGTGAGAPGPDLGFAPDDEARLAALHARHQAVRLLCLTRGRPTGVEAVNAWLHRRHGATTPTPIPGEPVVMLRNDYERSLFNGDQGVVIRARPGAEPPRLMAVFPVGGRFRAWDLGSLRGSIELGYALTVHRAQGSECDEVALLLPDLPLPLLTRELIYTALTRSRRAVVLCGTPAVLAAGVARPLTRSTGVGEKLRAALFTPAG